MDKGDNFITLSEIWQMWSWVCVREERSLRQHRRSYAPKLPKRHDECRVNMAEAESWFGTYTWAVFCILECKWNSGRFHQSQAKSKERHIADWRLPCLKILEYFNNSVGTSKEKFGWCFKQMNKGTAFCKVNCFSGSQRKWAVILAPTSISKIID